MRSVFVGAFVAFVISLFGTPLAIRAFTKLRADQPIRSDGPQTHLGKKGTPTMGGVVFILATLIAYVAGHLVMTTLPDKQLAPTGPTTTAVVLLGLFVCTGILGFVDDYLKVSKRNSAGMSKRGKLIGQTLIGGVFGAIALYFPSKGVTGPQSQLTVASTALSFVRDIDWLNVGKVGAVVVFVLVVTSMSNAVNLTDGLDGLATGASVMVIGAYMAIAFWQYRHWCSDPSYQLKYCYEVRDPLEVALIAGAAAGALFGFLWWNASPARIFMGDTGALALGSLIAGLALATKTILLVPIIGVLFFLIVVTWVMQIGSFRLTGKRIFRMVPLQHHFELAGWSEVNIVIRFWIIAAIGVVAAMALFYADFLAAVSGFS
ncbi:MAG TPA: phospho-N-acetylmuramoyl-pentapeptide-transferase [Micromonosporaceae bacterium]|nr:phospho-N-acetylmuramoyl-pentapeptide-transferase [Micromonosporaceae bacterium]